MKIKFRTSYSQVDGDSAAQNRFKISYDLHSLGENCFGGYSWNEFCCSN